MTMTSLWRNFSWNVVANRNWSCLSISVSEVYCMQSTAALDGAADATKSMWLCARCTCLSTMPLLELSANDWKGTTATYNSSNLNVLEISCLRSDAWSYFETFIRNQKQVSLDKIWVSFLQVQLTKLSRVLDVWQE